MEIAHAVRLQTKRNRSNDFGFDTDVTSESDSTSDAETLDSDDESFTDAVEVIEVEQV